MFPVIDMKFNMYMPSAAQCMSKSAVKFITYFFVIVILFVIGFGIYCCFFNSWESVLLLFPLVLIIYMLYILILGRPRSYIEVDGTNIKVVYYAFFVKREKNILVSQIQEAYILPVRVKGSSLMPEKIRPYEIFFKDKDGRRLFRVYCTEASCEFFKGYIVNYEAYIKRINEN